MSSDSRGSHVSINITVSPELQRALNAFPVNLAKHMLNHAVSEAALVIQNQAVENAPEWHGEVDKGAPPPGTLKKAIHRVYNRDASTNFHSQFLVFVKHGKAAQFFKARRKKGEPVAYINRDAYYWWFVENGSVHNAAVHFMANAVTAKAKAAVDRFNEVLASGISQAVNESR